jgi:hypothetical protein
MGWPLDALKGVRRRVWIAHYKGIACAVGAGFENRANSTAHMVLDALRLRASHSWIPNFNAVSIAVHDDHCNEADLAYATNGKYVTSCREHLVPSFIFDKWVKARIFDFSDTITNLSVIAHEHRRPSHCGWAGNHLSDGALKKRQQLVDVARTAPSVLQTVTVASSKTSWLTISQQVQRWRCLIDVRGSGFSARVPVLLHSGRPLLFVARPYMWTWLTDPASPALIRPWVHFVPVLDDLSDLVQKTQWVFQNPHEADKIAFQALTHAKTFLTREFAQGYLLHQVLDVVAERSKSEISK